jgi:hypothetical protein
MATTSVCSAFRGDTSSIGGNASSPPTATSMLTSAIAILEPKATPSFGAIQRLFDHLRSNAADAEALNSSYASRGIFKTAATTNKLSDQKYTIDISPHRLSLIPADLRASLAPHGFDEIVSFFNSALSHMPYVLSSLSSIVGADLTPLHASENLNFRLCDYNPVTADCSSSNGCGAHTDYGTFTIIFQDGTAGLEIESYESPGTWIPVPGESTVVLAGWCAVILSGGIIKAARHRVRRIPGVRRFSAVLFVAPDVNVSLHPLEGIVPVKKFSDTIMEGKIDVKWFKEVMGKRWRFREGNETLEDVESGIEQDRDIEMLVWA